MAEISREDAIKRIKCYMEEDCGCDCDECELSMQSYFSVSLDKAISDMQKLEKIEQNLSHIDVAIRCAMCTNPMHTDRGCDGGCTIDKDMYKKVLDVVDKEIEQILKE